MNEFKIGDFIVYVPPYITRYSDRYNGIIISISNRFVLCKLGFGMKWCKPEDLVLNSLKTITNNVKEAKRACRSLRIFLRRAVNNT